MQFTRTIANEQTPGTTEDVLNWGRLFLTKADSTRTNVSDEQVRQWLEWWWKEEINPPDIEFDTVPCGMLSAMLKARVYGWRVQINSISRPDGQVTLFASAVDNFRKAGQVEFTQDESDALSDYLKMRIDGILPDEPIRLLSPLFMMIYLIEESPVANSPIDSDEFQTSKLGLIPETIIEYVAERAGLDLLQPIRHSFQKLVRLAGKAASGRGKPETQARESGTSGNDPGHSENEIPPEDVQEVNRMMRLKRWQGKTPIEVCRAYIKKTYTDGTPEFVETQSQNLKRKWNRYK